MIYVRKGLSVVLSVFALYTALFGVFPDVIQRGVFLLLSLSIIYVGHIEQNKKGVISIIIDVLLILLNIVALLNVIINFEDLAMNFGQISLTETILGIGLILTLLVATKRTVGWPIVIIALCFLVYGYFGQVFPGGLKHGGFSIERMISHLYLGTNGIFSTPMGTAATLVMSFIVFGAFLESSGGSKFFMDISIALTGRSVGGPAKAAVVSSALMGTISGAAATNVVTTGTFTIPLMKRIGYKDHVAGAIEAVASTGGQLMPPVMGAAAFIMAEIMAVPYREVVLAAIIPSVLYFASVFAMVHFEAHKSGVTGVPKEEIPLLKKVIARDWHTFLSVAVLITMLAMGFSAMYAGFFATLAAFIASWVKKHTRMGIKRMIEAMISAADNVLGVACACATAGIIIGVISQTGLGLKISSLIVTLSGGNLLLALILTMIALIILGMGMPTAAAYILVATLVAPALIDMDVVPIAAHMFVFFGAILSAITPPVALAAYAASGIAKANPMRIAFTAVQFGIVAFIIPFFFVYQPSLLLQGDALSILGSVCTALIGCIALSVGMRGFFLYNVTVIMRIIIIAGALFMIYPGLLTDAIGGALMLVVALPQIVKRMKNKNADISEIVEAASTEPQATETVAVESE